MTQPTAEQERGTHRYGGQKITVDQEWTPEGYKYRMTMQFKMPELLNPTAPFQPGQSAACFGEEI